MRHYALGHASALRTWRPLPLAHPNSRRQTKKNALRSRYFTAGKELSRDRTIWTLRLVSLSAFTLNNTTIADQNSAFKRHFFLFSSWHVVVTFTVHPPQQRQTNVLTRAHETRRRPPLHPRAC